MTEPENLAEIQAEIQPETGLETQAEMQPETWRKYKLKCSRKPGWKHKRKYKLKCNIEKSLCGIMQRLFLLRKTQTFRTPDFSDC